MRPSLPNMIGMVSGQPIFTLDVWAIAVIECYCAFPSPNYISHGDRNVKK